MANKHSLVTRIESVETTAEIMAINARLNAARQKNEDEVNEQHRKFVEQAKKLALKFPLLKNASGYCDGYKSKSEANDNDKIVKGLVRELVEKTNDFHEKRRRLVDSLVIHDGKLSPELLKLVEEFFKSVR